jgi:hypothetical protein
MIAVLGKCNLSRNMINAATEISERFYQWNFICRSCC